MFYYSPAEIWDLNIGKQFRIEKARKRCCIHLRVIRKIYEIYVWVNTKYFMIFFPLKLNILRAMFSLFPANLHRQFSHVQFERVLSAPVLRILRYARKIRLPIFKSLPET